MTPIPLRALSEHLLSPMDRRALTRCLATLPLCGGSALLFEDVASRHRRARQRRRHLQEEKKKKKALCLNGQTIMATKKKRKKLLKKGATLGACQQACVPSSWAYRAQLGAGSAGSGNNQFNGPYKVALAADGLTAWVSDSVNNRIVVWTRPNAASAAWAFNARFGSFGTGNNGFSGPGGVAVSGDGQTAWIADTSNNRVMVWTRPTASSTDWVFNAQIGTGISGAGDFEFAFPSGVAVTPDGLTAWIADTGNDRVVVWKRATSSSTDWTYSAQFGSTGSGVSEFDKPYDVAVTATGLRAWVADSFNHRVMVWTRSDISSTSWSFEVQLGTGSSGSGNNQFATPYGVAVSADGVVAFVADAGNARIAIWRRTGANSTDWTFIRQLGSGGSGSGNGQFDAPYGVALSANGLVAAIADPNNYRVPIWSEMVCDD